MGYEWTWENGICVHPKRLQNMNVSKTKELIVDFGKQKRNYVPRVPWCPHDRGPDLGTAYWRLRIFWVSRQILRNLYCCTIESVLRVTSCPVQKQHRTGLQGPERVVRLAERIIGGALSCLKDIYTSRCVKKARKIIKDSSHPDNGLFSLLQLERRYWICHMSERLRKSFYPQATGILNAKWGHWLRLPPHHTHTVYLLLFIFYLNPLTNKLDWLEYMYKGLS